MDLERFNTEDFPATWTVEYRPGHLPLVVRAAGRRISINANDGVFYRRPEPPRYDGLTPAVSDWCSKEAAEAWQSVVLSSNARFLHHPWKTQFASNKIWQLRCAESVGFRIPQTLLTNSPASLIDFSRSHPSVVYKTMKQPFFESEEGEGARIIYTSRVPDSILANESAVKMVPSLYQEEVPKLHEVRATVVGSRVFACQIESQQSTRTNVDWRRYDFANTPHTVCDLSQSENSRVLNLMEALGLNFGCIDMIRHPDGDLVFLEVNVNGQWLWIEELTGMKISAAILAWLEGATD